jgi:hypothetical protein
MQNIFAILLLTTMSALACVNVRGDVIYRPGSLQITAAAGMQNITDGTWDFRATTSDPYTKIIRFPSVFPTDKTMAIAVEIEKNKLEKKDVLEIFPVLDNDKRVTTSQKLAIPLKEGNHRYVFETGELPWFKGNLQALRIDPGTAPGVVSIKSIGIFEKLPVPEPGDVLVPVPVDRKASQGKAIDTFEQANLVRYRLSSGQMEFAILSSWEDLPKVVKLHLHNSSPENRNVSLSFAAKKLAPFSPVIPPYIGLGAETFSIKIWDAPKALKSSAIRIGRADGSSRRLALDTKQLVPQKWNTLSWPLHPAGEPAKAITSIEFIGELPPSTDAIVFIASPILEGKKLPELYDLLTTEAPSMMKGMVSPLASQPVRALPTRDSLCLGGDIRTLGLFGLDDTGNPDNPDKKTTIAALAALVRKEFPNRDFILSPLWTPPLTLAEVLPTLPEGVFVQFQKAQLAPGYLQALDRMPRNARGEALKTFGNSVLATDPVIQRGLKDEIDYAASLGVNNFKQVDYVWRYVGGRWGYDKASIAAFRSALSETDEGLLLLPGLSGKLAKGGLARFWDYYEYYHGFRLKPADLGLKGWNDYVPVSEQAAAKGGDIEKRNLGVFILLYHYEWLRQAQRFGRWAKAHGGSHSYTHNPEDLGNGNDYIFIVHLADAGIPYIEYFGGPSILKGAYHNLPLYTRSAGRAGRKFGLILEMGQGGHGQPYLDPEINYLFAWELAAAGLRNYHNEWAESGWLKLSNPANEYMFDRWSNWMTGALGFTFARDEKVTRPDTRVFNISIRSPGYYISSWIPGLNQGPSFGPLLADNHVPYKQWDRSEMPEILGEADVIFYSAPFSRTQDWKALRDWLKSPGKTLVTHSNLPFSLDDGQSRLNPGVQNVNYTGPDQSYTDFLTEVANYKATIFPEFKSLRPLANGNRGPVPGAQILAGDNKNPLLSTVSLAGNSKLYYLHCNPVRMDERDRAQVMKILVDRLNLPRTVVSSSKPVMAHHFASPRADVLNVWTGLDLPGFRGGYGEHLMPRRGASTFDPAKRPYPWLSPAGETISVDVPVDEEATYRVFSFLAGEESVIKSTPRKLLRLEVKGVFAEQFYYAKDGPGIREMITILKKHRERLFPYAPHMPRSDNVQQTRLP